MVSGPVEIAYPCAAEVVPVVSTEEMLEASLAVFPSCDGLIAVAAPCDYRPITVQPHKIAKTGQPLTLQLVETPDIVASLAGIRTSQWLVAFALETRDRHMRAMQKLERKSCDLIVLNGPGAICAQNTEVEVITRKGEVICTLAGSKDDVAMGIFRVIQERLMQPTEPAGREPRTRKAPL